MLRKYDVTNWSDFVRGLVTSSEEEAMRSARLQGGPAVVREIQFLRRVAAIAESDKNLGIAPAALRYAKSLGCARRPAEVEDSSWRRIFLPLTFDSLVSPLPAGVRNPAPAHRQLLFETKGYAVDVNLEGGCRSTLLVGQLLRRDPDVEPLEGVVVEVMANGELIGETRTGRFGEFQTSRLPRADIDLRFLIAPSRCLEMSVAAPESH